MTLPEPPMSGMASSHWDEVVGCDSGSVVGTVALLVTMRFRRIDHHRCYLRQDPMHSEQLTSLVASVGSNLPVSPPFLYALELPSQPS